MATPLHVTSAVDTAFDSLALSGLTPEEQVQLAALLVNDAAWHYRKQGNGKGHRTADALFTLAERIGKAALKLSAALR